LDGFATIEQGDIVIDGGAHVGGFSLAAADRGDHVYAVEPDPRVQQALTQTVQDRDNISVHEIALTDHSGELEFLLGPDPSENSFINVDTGEEVERIAVTTSTLEDFIASIEHDAVDFLKLDAEGAEPEVLRGLGETKPTTVAIDAGPERNGERTIDTVVDLLESNGHETRVRNDVVF
jgi:FkbM family methyltransferase